MGSAADLTPSYDDSVPPPPSVADPEPDSELPGYTLRSQAEFSEQAYQLEDTKGRPWIWLKVKSRAGSGKQVPLFFDRDTLSGTVEVDFSKADGAKAVTIAVVAGVTAVGQDEIKFLDINHELWEAKLSPKPSGKTSWPYSIVLPTETAVADKGKKQGQVYPLPPNFSERASPAYIDYRLVVTVRKSSFRVNQTLSTSFAYVPLTRAPPPSPLRELAYREGSSLVGPQADPEGWKVSAPIKIAGTLFESRKVELECTLAIAAPLTYALGNPIPLVLTIKSSDEQALDLLATPSAIRVALTRFRLVGSHAVEDDLASGRSNNSFTNDVGHAVFWPFEEGAPEPGTRVLQGELEVKKTLKVGFVFPRFSVRYALGLWPFQAPGFTPASSSSQSREALLVQPVTICTVNAAGVTPRSYAPPGYADKPPGDYNTAVGYLENGNQRFLPHHGFM